MTRRRGRWPLLALLLALGLAACADPGSADRAEPDDCGTCDEEVRRLRDAVSRLDGVVRVRDLSYRPDDPNDGSAVVAALTIDSEDGDALADEVARLGWTSAIPDLDGVDVTMRTPSGAVLKPLPYNFYAGRDADHYTELWGPRPG